MRVVVLGAGIAGLAAALRLRELTRERSPALAIALVDRSPRAGGCIETRLDDGYLMEIGAESLPIEKPWAIALLDRLGLHDDLLEPRAETKGTLLLRGGKLRRLPENFSVLVPRSLLALLASGLFSPSGVVRAAMEPFVPARTSHEDESLASFVTRRMGSQVLDSLAQPLLGGIYSADPSRLSMAATLPQMLEAERRFGSLIRATRRTKPRSSTRLVTLRHGLNSIVDAVIRRLHDVELVRAEVVSVQRTPRTSAAWQIVFADGGTTDADALLCALPAPVAARVLAGASTELAALLRSIQYNSLAVVTLAYRRCDVPTLPRAHGILVPFVERKHVTAVTLSSSKYAQRAPEGDILLRAYVGGALQSALLDRDDDVLIALVRADLREMLSFEAKPLFAFVRRWTDALPEYAVGHLDRVGAMEQAAAAMPRFALAGAAYRGVGVSDCVRGAEEAAERVARMCAKQAQAET
jgi:protoporphyrinogen/coproporphyrinogen III oxidase